MWSYGIVMWEVMSYGERPYWDMSNQDVSSFLMLFYFFFLFVSIFSSFLSIPVWWWCVRPKFCKRNSMDGLLYRRVSLCKIRPLNKIFLFGSDPYFVKSGILHLQVTCNWSICSSIASVVWSWAILNCRLTWGTLRNLWLGDFQKTQWPWSKKGSLPRKALKQVFKSH